MDVNINDRVEVHPGTNAWIFGDRFGQVTKLGTKYVHVKMDTSQRTLKFLPRDIYRKV